MAEDSALKEVFKDKLTKLNESFPEEFSKLSLYKNVSRLERKATAYFGQINNPEKINRCFMKILEECCESTKKECSNKNNDQNCDIMSDAILDIAVKLNKLQQLNSQITEMSVKLKIEDEETTIKDHQKDLLSELKFNFNGGNQKVPII